MNLKTIEGKKHENISGPVKVNSKMDIKNVKEQDLPALNNKGLSIEFDFETKYISEKNKNIADIKINGDVIFMGKEKDKVLKNWKKDKTLPEDMKIPSN